MLEKHQTCGGRHEYELPGKVCRPHRRRQLGEGLESHERPHIGERSTSEKTRVQRRRQFGRLSENPPGAIELRPGDESGQASLVESMPKRGCGMLVACAEERPPIVTLVVLRPRQREGADQDSVDHAASFPAFAASASSAGHAGLSSSSVLDKACGLPLHKLAQLGEDVTRDPIEPWLEIVRLLVFVDLEGVAGADREGRRRVRAARGVWLDANIRRRHELRVGAQLEPASSVEGLSRFGLDLPPDVAHSPSLR